MKITKRLFVLGAAWCFVLSWWAGCSGIPQGISKREDLCSFGKAVETDGYRRLALIVGVGKYRNEKVNSLIGPSNDARRVYDLLTGKHGYDLWRMFACCSMRMQQPPIKEFFERRWSSEPGRMMLSCSILPATDRKQGTVMGTNLTNGTRL
jgi:hypothetical protein